MWVTRAAERREQRLAEPAPEPSKPIGPICGEYTVFWPDDEHLEAVCHQPAGHSDVDADGEIEHVSENGILNWCTPATA